MDLSNIKNLDQLNAEMVKAMEKNDFSVKKPVFGQGNIKSKIVLVGEAPGKYEEQENKPFVGKAGKNLSEFLEILGLKREEIYITNIVKIRPIKTSAKGIVSNRTPTRAEVDFFAPFLRKEIEIINPKLVVTLGNIPLAAVANDKAISIGSVHGQLIKSNIFPLYHPAAIIYKPIIKDVYEQDLETLKKLLKSYENK